MNETLNSIRERRSTRVYKQEQIKDEELQLIIEAGRYAPSAANQQPWHFTVIQNKEALQKINQGAKAYFQKSNNPHFQRFASSEKFHVFHNAPTAIIISGDQSAMLPQVDCAAATENMLIAAQSLGIGACWTQNVIHLFEGEQATPIKEELGIPDKYRPLYAISLGYKAQDNQQAPPRKENNVNYIK